MGNVGIVIPPDTRVQVNPTTVFPYWSTGQLVMTFPNGKQYTGTGTLIDERHVLTCAHNLFGEGQGGPAQQVLYLPARDGNTVPYGVALAERIFYPENYVLHPPANPNVEGIVVQDYTQYLFDYGLVRLNAGINPGNLMTMYAAADNALQGQDVELAGYPGDKPIGTMWNGSGVLPNQLDEHFLFYGISTYKGQSGSSIRFATGAPQNPLRIVGIHVAGLPQFNANFAVRLTDEIIEQMADWMNS